MVADDPNVPEVSGRLVRHRISTNPGSTPSVSAAIMVTMPGRPVPISWVPTSTTARPSACTRTLAEDGIRKVFIVIAAMPSRSADPCGHRASLEVRPGQPKRSAASRRHSGNGRRRTAAR